METITFYSYKGGVGRTLALANIAVYLSRFGQKVCVVDFDLEAPGVHYKLSEFFPGPIDDGLVDYIHEFTSTGKVPAKLDRFVMDAANLPEKYGNIQLIPAGNVLSTGYWKKLASIDWHGLFYREGGEGVPFFLEFKERIAKELNPDFLLIDSRTGITEVSGVCTSILPDRVVFLIVNNRENIEGSRQILRGIQKAKRLDSQEPVNVNFVLTRIPLPKDEDDVMGEQEIIKNIKGFLEEGSEQLDEQLNIKEIQVLHSDRTLELSESLRLNHDDARKKPLVKDYLRLFSKIISNKIDDLLEDILSPNTLIDAPDLIQKQLEAIAFTFPHPKSFEKLVDFYFMHNKTIGDKMILFCDLWDLSNDFSSRLYAKFSDTFLKIDSWLSIADDSKVLAIAEEYLKTNPLALIETEARKYDDKSEEGAALKFLLRDRGREWEKEKVSILKKIIERRFRMGDYNSVFVLYYSYNKEILANRDLKLLVLRAFLRIKDTISISSLLRNDQSFEGFVFEKSLDDYVQLMKIMGREDTAVNELTPRLRKAILNGDHFEVVAFGNCYYKLNKSDIFINSIPDDFPDKIGILRELESSYRKQKDFMR